MAEPSLYERELLEQPEALRRLARTSLPAGLSSCDVGSYPRIVLTGMGSSHFAAIPLWRGLVAAGLPAWWISATQLLDSPDLVTADTLVVMTSQSGYSGEVVAAIDGAIARPRTLIAVTNDPVSPLGRAADICLELHSGDEATVSAKSYLNTLAAHRRLGSALRREDPAAVAADIRGAADDLEAFDCGEVVADLARRTVTPRTVTPPTVKGDSPRVALIGKRDQAATALMGGLIAKEGAKVAAEGYVGGDFRHGPLEIAGPGLTAVLFAGSDDATADDSSLEVLAAELAGAGSDVLVVGARAPRGVPTIHLPAGTSLAALVLAANVAQVLSVELARAGGRVPGEFLFGKKITSSL